MISFDKMGVTNRQRKSVVVLAAAALCLVVSFANADNIDGDVGASFPESGAQSLSGALASATVEPSSGILKAELPISLPTARGIGQPLLQLTYSSAAGVRDAGVGWGLSLPVIERSTRKGPPLLNDSLDAPGSTPKQKRDEILFNGERLVPVCEADSRAHPCDQFTEPLPAWASPGTRYYRLEVDNHARFFLSSDGLTWRVQLLGGEVLEFGRPLALRLDDDANQDNAIDFDETTKIVNLSGVMKPVTEKTLPFRWNIVTRFQANARDNAVAYRWRKLGSSGRGYLTDLFYSSSSKLRSRQSDERLSTSSFAHHVNLHWNYIPQPGNLFTPLWRVLPDFTLARIDVASKRYDDPNGPRALVRRYHLGYKGHQRAYLHTLQMEGRCISPIEEVAEQLPTTDCPRLPSTTLNWSEPELNTVAEPIVMEHGNSEVSKDSRIVPIDVNGDSLVDIVEGSTKFSPDDGRPFDAYGALEPSVRNVYMHGADHLFERWSFEGPAGLFSNFGYTFTGDFEGTGETSAVFFAPQAARDCGNGGPEHRCTGPTYVTLRGIAFRAEKIGNSRGWAEYIWDINDSVRPVAFSRDIADFHVDAVGDVNGDGVPDAVDAHTSSSTGRAQIDVRYGARLADADGIAFPYLESSASCVGPSRDMLQKPVFGDIKATIPPALADMNGDGLADLVLLGPKQIEYWQGDGRGNFGACRGASCDCSNGPVQTPSATMISPEIGSGLPLSRHWRLGDLNGDGYADLLTIDRNGLNIYFNIDGLLLSQPVFISGASLFFDHWKDVQDNLDALNVSLADMNGNGITDIVLQLEGKLKSIDLHRVVSPIPAFADDAFAPRPGLLIAIDNGLGAKSEFSYVSTADLTAIASLGDRPWIHRLPQVFQVVNRVTVRSNMPGTQPTRTAYDYRDPAWDGYERRFLGFREVTATRLGSVSISTRTHFYIPDCPRQECWSRDRNFKLSRVVSGAPLFMEIFDSQGHYLNSIAWSYDIKEVMHGVDGTPIRFAYPKTVDTRLYDVNDWQPGDGTSNVEVRFGDRPPLFTAKVPIRSENSVLVRATQELDNYGNVFKITDFGRVKDNGALIDDPIVKTIRYLSDQGQWAFLPEQVKIEAFPDRPGVPADHLRTRWYKYDRLNRLTEIQAYLSGTEQLKRRHESGRTTAPTPSDASKDNLWVTLARFRYDNFNNIIEIRGPNGRCKHIDFDKEYAQLPAKITNYLYGCVGAPHTSEQHWDRGMEAIVKSVAPNGTVIKDALDSFGRPIAIWRSDSKTGMTPSLPWATLKYEDVANGPVQRGAIEVRDSVSVARTAWVYADGLGRRMLTLSQADPGSGDGGAWVARGLPKLDAFNQVVETNQPWFYDGNPRLHPLVAPEVPSTKLKRDAFERVTEIKRPDGTSELRMILRPLELESIDALGRSSTITFDGHGRPSELRSKGSLGNEAFVKVSYLVQGETARITRWDKDKPKEIYSRWMRYDSLGRMVENAEPNSAFQYADDPAASGGSTTWRYAYNDAGDLVGTSDARGCGQNFFYDALGRLLGADYSPCRDSHAPYSPINVTTGGGAEALFRYDRPENGQTGDFGVSNRNLAGRLVATMDRANHTRYAYDWRGRPIGLSRQLARPENASGEWPEAFPNGEARFTNNWFRQSIEYDDSDRLISFTTGATMEPATESKIQLEYNNQGGLRSLFGVYGLLLSQVEYAADGRPQSLKYGDVAKTSQQLTYDVNRRLSHSKISRIAPQLWTQGLNQYTSPASTDSPTQQLVLFDSYYDYDPAGFLKSISDSRDVSAWPDGAKPTSFAYSYDEFGRLSRVDYARNQPDISIKDAGANSLPALSMPHRVAYQTFSYDGSGNIIEYSDDSNAIFDRSLGTMVHGTKTEGPNQLKSASDGAIQVHYDAVGNIEDVDVVRPQPCDDVRGKCSLRFSYEWDEVGRLARARRWDVSAGSLRDNPPYPRLPSVTPDAEERFRYGADGVRFLKSKVVRSGSAIHTAFIFDTLKLEGVKFDEVANDYRRDANAEVVEVPGVAEVRQRGGLPDPSGGSQHVLLYFTDHLGSAIAKIDASTAEVIQQTAFQGYGVVDSDYRPARWEELAGSARFTGKEYDPDVGIVYFGARYYNPYLAQWMSPDPLTIHSVSGELNPYSYVGGAPSRSTDAQGLDASETGGCLGAEICGLYGQISDPSYDYDASIDGPRPAPSAPAPVPTSGPDTVPLWQAFQNRQLWSSTIDSAAVAGFNAGVEKNQWALAGTGFVAAAAGALLTGVAAVDAGAGLLAGAARGLQTAVASVTAHTWRAALWFTEFGLSQQGIAVGGSGITAGVLGRVERAQQIRDIMLIDAPFLGNSAIAVGDVSTRNGVTARLVATNRSDVLKWLLTPGNLKLHDEEMIVPTVVADAEINLANWGLRNGFVSGGIGTAPGGCQDCTMDIVFVVNMLKGGNFTHDNMDFNLVDMLLNRKFFWP